MPKMLKTDIRPQNTEEKIVWVTLVFSYIFYLTGTFYVVAALVGWGLLFVALLRWFVSGKAPLHSCLPITIIVWLVGMFFMLVALWVAHADYSLSLGQTIKSTIGWAKGWALLALFPLLGAWVSIRPKLLIRACCILSSQSLLFVFLGLLLVVIGFQGHLYTSPLKAVGGPISTFEVGLYGMNPETGKPRWSFFAPWAPAAGLLSCVLLIICSHEKNDFWRRMGKVGALVMCLFCQSRSGWALFLALIPVMSMSGYLKKPVTLIFLGVLSTLVVVLSQPVIEQVNQVHQDIKDARPGSTRVRNALATIALQRWESEAPIWGHGIVEKGPKMVEFMPIGSHHSWYGLLFVKGLVGLLALAIPLLITVLYLLPQTLRYQGAKSALLITVVLIGYSFFENLEILAYLYWPALLWLGMALSPLKITLFEDESKGVAV